MKKICIIFISLFICNSASAGLFEYHLGVSTPSNGILNADTIETVEQYQAPKYQKSYSNTYQRNGSTYYDNSLDYFYSNNTYLPKSYDYNITYNKEFYRYDDIKDILEDNLERLERENDMINDIRREIKDEIRRLNKYSGSYYRDLRNQLEDNYDDLKDRQRDINDMIDDLEDEIKDFKRYKGKSKSSSYNYYNNRNYYNSWSNSNYNNRYDYYSNYNNRAYYKYDYDNDRYIPHWVNPNLEAINDGHIYIR